MRTRRTKRSKRLVSCRVLSVLTAASLMFTNIPANMIGSVTGSQVAALSEVSAATDYGLADNIQDGTILHCFNWKYKDIEAELANIAEAGFTSIQTSPAQRDDSYNEWYMLYQPQTFSIYTNALGTKAELQSLCTKAEQYGINVIVDVVANHTRAVGDDGLGGDCYHDAFDAYYTDRYGITHGKIGMPDLKSESSTVQNKVKGYIQELKSVGVDGIRWDAAKHISLPSEQWNNQFWPVVTSVGLYNYGEILVGPLESGGESLMKEYTNYMSVTDSVYGKNVRSAFEYGNVPSSIGNWSERGVSKNKLVYWGESHDTYSNNGEYGEASQRIDQNKIDRAYAVVAAQDKATSLYFSRPFATNKPDIKAGAKGSTNFTSDEVAQVNHFHNAMVGQKEWYVGDTNNNVAAVCREKGAVVVLGSGGDRDVSVANGGSTVASGTYTDQVSGSTWTVTSSTISGRVGSSGIAVLYNPGSIVKTPTATISKEGGSFNSDTLSLTIGLKNATSGTYQIGNEAAQTFTGSTTITIGSGMAEGESVTVKLTATDGTNTATESYTFTKKKNVVDGSYDIYFTKPDSWGSSINCYAYVDENTSNAAWPGVAMENLGDGIYGYNLPDSWTNAKVIFNDRNNQDPASKQPGLDCTNGTSVIYENGAFTEVEVSTKGTVTVKYVDEAGNEITTSTSLQGTVGSAYTTTAATVAGYTLKKTPANASGTYTAATITVTYVYTEDVDDETPKVTSSLASGSTFDAETESITLTLKNATKGTYSVDNGPVKQFTDKVTIEIGKGKIADSEIEVKTTAIGTKETTEQTFKYNKKFNYQKNGAGVEYTTENVPASRTAPTDDKYTTNPDGQKGQKKTITKASDFDESMIIAQGVANDDPSAFKGTHEAPKFDMYAMYGAWDDENLYIGIQYTNVIDVVDPAQEAPQTGRAKPNGADADIPQMLAFDLGTDDYTDGSTNDAKQKTVWNSNINFGGDTKVDKILMYSPKDGISNYALFPVKGGKIDYDAAIAPGYNMPFDGASLTWEDGFFGSSMVGIKKNGYEGYKPSDLESSSSAWVDFLSENHNTKHDTFCIVTISLDKLGVTADQIATDGIGVMSVATYGSSGIGCLPMDMTMLDVACDAYSQDDSTSAEKEDNDVITVPLARLGAGGGTVVKKKLMTVNFGADRSAPQTAGTALTLEAIAEGGMAPYTYAYYVNGTALDTESSDTSTKWTPAEGTYTIKCVVTDSIGNNVTCTKEYTVESNGGGEDDCTHATKTVKNKKEATCTEKGYTGDTHCAECDALIESGTEISVADHKWGNGIVTKEPTETETGVKTYTCTGCTATKTDTIPMLNHTTHTWGDGVVTTEPTEDKEGVLTYTCTGCTATKTEVIPKKTHVHTWGDGVVTTEPTEDKEGVLTYTCTGCTATKSEAIAKLSHTHTWDAGTVTKEPTETTVGEKTFKCTTNGCTATKVVPISTNAHVHNWVGKVTTEPTEDKEGVLTYTCTGCTATKTESIKKLDHVHSWGIGVITKQPTDTDLGVITYTCTECSLTKTEEVTKPKHEHSWGTGVITKQPTDTKEGVLTYTCTECTATKTEPLAKADHAHTWGAAVITKQPTETEEGTKTYTCTGCTATKTESIAKLAHAHTWGTAVITKQPTATEKGVKTSTCTTCKATKTEEVPATGGNPTVTIPSEGETFDDALSNATYRVTKDNANSKEVEFVFVNAKTSKVVILPTVTVGNVVYKVTSISDGAFKNNKYIKSVEIGANVKKIGESAFQKCKNLTSVTMGKNVTTIGNKAFYKCTALTNVKMSSKITKIGSQAFYKCTKLKSITIPSKVKSIGKKAFYGCKNLKKITIKTTKLNKNNVGSQAFKGINSKAKIKVPKKKLSSYKKMLRAKGVSSKAKISK